MTVAGSIRVVQQVLVKGILYSGLNKAYRLAFITVFSIRVIMAYFFILVPISMVNKF